jgi:nucleoside-diphosphate-sugar epimerase
MEERPLLLLGVGQVGQAITELCRDSRRVVGTTRDPKRLFDLFHERIEPIVMPWPSADVIAPLAKDADVVVSFAPDGKTDGILASACMEAHSIVYVSTTSVYGGRTGTIDDTTPIEELVEANALRIEAEKIWRSVGANVVRPAAIYGSSGGLHKRLAEGTFKLPGDGSNMSSRIHVEDLAAMILGLLASEEQGRTFVVADELPATHLEVVSWLCEQMNLPMPQSADIESVHSTLKSNRSVDGSGIRKLLNYKLKYPTFREGYAAVLASAGKDEEDADAGG